MCPTSKPAKTAFREVEAKLGAGGCPRQQCRYHRDTTIKRLDQQKWQDVIDTNLGGCFNMAKAVFEGMSSRGYGRIVNIGSINGRPGNTAG